MDNIRSQLLKVVQPSTSSLDLGGSFPRSNDVMMGVIILSYLLKTLMRAILSTASQTMLSL